MTKHHIYTMSIARVYPFLVVKAQRKGRMRFEVDEILRWLRSMVVGCF